MMAFNAPAPIARFSGSAEHSEEVPLRIADRSASLFLLEQDGFEAHDGCRRDVALIACPGANQRQGGFLLLGSHCFERQALARRFLCFLVFLRSEVPIGAFAAVIRETRLGLLLRLKP